MPIPGNMPGPNWYDTDWLYRWPVAIDAVTGTSSGSVDITISIPGAWDYFWDNVLQANGYDIVLCGPDGRTLLTFDYNGLSIANRTLTLEVQSFSLNASSKMEVIWLYWGYASATDQSTTFTPSTPISGYVELSLTTPYRFAALPMQYGSDTPLNVFQLGQNDVFYVGLDVTRSLPLRSHIYNNRFGQVGIQYITAGVDSLNASADDTTTRYLYYDNRLFVTSEYTASASNASATGRFVVVLTDGQTLTYRFGIDTQNVSY